MLRQTELQFIEDKAGKACPTCGKDVVGPAHKVYCSKRCKDSAWREANPERIKAQAQKWKKANPEKVKEQSRKYYEANSERIKVKHKKWKQANPEKLKESHRKSNKKWKKANPEKRKAQKHRRRARIRGNGFEDTSEFRARMTHPLVRQVCFYCGTDCTSSGDWHWDHRIPLAAGGPEAEWNLVIACVSCNLKKGAKVPKTLFAEEIFNEP